MNRVTPTLPNFRLDRTLVTLIAVKRSPGGAIYVWKKIESEEYLGCSFLTQSINANSEKIVQGLVWCRRWDKLRDDIPTTHHKEYKCILRVFAVRLVVFRDLGLQLLETRF